MKIALLGYGKEGQAAEKYFTARGAEIKIFENFTDEDVEHFNLDGYDLILRSPSVRPRPGWSSMTKYFFENCPCPIIGVTATKGKGTTCSFIASILKACGETVHLVGNIGVPAISELDKIQPTDVVVYEMSSFQLWNLDRSPRVAVVGVIEPDHLNVHRDYDEYVSAKANIARHQSANDYLVYYKDNADSAKIASESPATKIAYPTTHVPQDVLDSIVIPGRHNRDNAMAAILAVSCHYGLPVQDFIKQKATDIRTGLANFKGLPHRLEYLQTLNNVLYYDDNFATNPASMKVAVESFPEQKVVLILGGRDKTENEDLPEIMDILTNNQNLAKIVLMGESGHELYRRYQDERFVLVESLAEAVEVAKTAAESVATSSSPAILLMSPAAASFDMFENVYDRGDQFKKIVQKK